MSIAFLNGELVALADARISPLDRGFLFGDGVYEVIPSYQGRMVGFAGHIQRLQQGLAALQIDLPWDAATWQEKINALLAANAKGDWGVYIQVSRGADSKRFHAYPQGVTPTVFMFINAIVPPVSAAPEAVKPLKVSSTQDLRWQRCQIKSTSLLGNVMHFQQGYAAGCADTLLFDADEQVTEFSSANVFVVKQGEILTPPLDNHILPGITRALIIQIVREHSDIRLTERAISMDEVRNADEIWLTSSSKEIAPVTELDGKPVANGAVGAVWQHVIRLYGQYKFDY